MAKLSISRILGWRLQFSMLVVMMMFGAISFTVSYRVVVDAFNKAVEDDDATFQSVLSISYWTLNKPLAETFLGNSLFDESIVYAKIYPMDESSAWIEIGDAIPEQKVFKKSLIPLIWEKEIFGYAMVHYGWSQAYEVMRNVVYFVIFQVICFSLILYLIQKQLYRVYLSKPVQFMVKNSQQIATILKGKESAIKDERQRSVLTKSLKEFLENYQEPESGAIEWSRIIESERSLVESLLLTLTEMEEFLNGLERVNIDLSNRIYSRNQELAKRGREMSDIMDKLQYSQSIVMQQEKMATIGQLAAGIAHEINNPTGFIVANLNTLKGYFEDLGQQVTSAQNYDKEEINFILEDGKELIFDCLEGTERIQEIVNSLKGYSREEQKTDVRKFAPAEAIEAAIKITNNQVKYHAEVFFENQAEGKIHGSSGKMTQVVSNLLVNASHAIEDTNEFGEIHIAVQDLGGFVEVVLSDSGTGMSDETKAKAFDPFYTTKGVGKGTGLGLHIVKDVIETHFSGQIALEDNAPRGLLIRMLLPAENTFRHS